MLLVFPAGQICAANEPAANLLKHAAAELALVSLADLAAELPE
jgi:hypothetical protein